MNIYAFEQQLLFKLKEFKQSYLIHDEWPQELTKEEWEEQFLAFMGEVR